MSVILGDFSCFQKYCLLSLTRIVDFGPILGSTFLLYLSERRNPLQRNRGTSFPLFYFANPSLISPLLNMRSV